MLECLGAICKPGLNLLILPKHGVVLNLWQWCSFNNDPNEVVSGVWSQLWVTSSQTRALLSQGKTKRSLQDHKDSWSTSRVFHSFPPVSNSFHNPVKLWNETDCYSLTFPSKGIFLEKMHVLWVHCEMQNYAGFLKNGASLAFQDSRKPAWGGGANQGQDSAAPQRSHPGNWGLWGTAWDFRARMTAVLFSHARTLYTELRAARFPGNRNKDPPSSPKE